MNLQELIARSRTVRGIPFGELSVRYSSIGELLASRAASFPERPFLIFHDEDGGRVQLSYGEFRRRVEHVAAFLESAGIRRGDRVATLAHNHADTVVQYFAAWWIGAVVVPLNVGEEDDRLVYILENSGARLAFVRSEYLDRAERIAARARGLKRLIVCGAAREGLAHFEECMRHPIDGTRPPEVGMLDAESLIVYTSGTTGNPKGVLLAQGNILADAHGISEWHRIGHESRMMCVLPIHHVNGTIVTLVTPMYAGASVVLNRKFQSGTFFERAAAEGVSIVSVVPTLLAFLVQQDVDTTVLDLSRFRHIICGAGPLTCELAARFEERYGIPIIHGYGLSETTCYSCFLPIDLPRERRLEWLTAHGFPSIGVPIPQNEMAIHDDAGNRMPAGERGEIVIRGHNVMLEYYANEEANRTAFAHGWFRSGDEGFFLEGDDGRPYFFITGRLKELIIRGGVNISPLEIDEVINGHPKVDAGIAVGFENSWYGEEVGAYVRPADESLTEEELLEYCRLQLPFHKTPKVVVFGEDIPVTSTGKYQRNRVKELFSAHKEAQFSAAERGKM